MSNTMVTGEMPATQQLDGIELSLTNNEKHLIETLRVLAHDPAMAHLIHVWTRRLAILSDRDRRYNGHNTVTENIFGNGDAEAFINSRQTFMRLSNKVQNGGGTLRKEIPHKDIEGEQLLDDAASWFDLWACCRMERESRPS